MAEKATKEPSFEEQTVEDATSGEQGPEWTEAPLPEKAKSPEHWAKQFNLNYIGIFLEIAIDSKNNIFVAASFKGTAKLGNVTFTSKSTEYDMFVGKIDSRGNWLWIKQIHATKVWIGKLTVDQNDDLLLTGYFSGTVKLGSTTLTSDDQHAFYISKLHSSGKWLWARGISATKFTLGNSIHVRGNKGILFTGRFKGESKIKGKVYQSGPAGSLLVAALTHSGEWSWLRFVHLEQYSYIHDSVIQDDKVTILGYFQGKLSFGKSSLQAQKMSTFISRIDSQGNWLWAKDLKTVENSPCHYKGLAQTKDGAVLLTGAFNKQANFGKTTLRTNHFHSNIFVAKMDANGHWLWAKHIPSSETGYGTHLTSTPTGAFFLTGSFLGKVFFGKTILHNTTGPSDIFIAKFSQNGTPISAKRMGSDGIDEGDRIVVDKNGNVIVGGYFEGKINFEGTVLQNEPLHRRSRFLWKTSLSK